MHIKSLLGGGPIKDSEEKSIRAYRKRGIGEIIWNVTERCNLKCRHCYMNAQNLIENGELSTEEALSLVDGLADLGVPLLFITGGEPLMRKDIFRILDRANDHGIRTVLSTNGTLINPETAEKIAKSGVHFAAVPIYGPEKFHDLYTGVEGSYRRMMEGVGLLAEEGVNISFKVTISKSTVENIPFIFEKAKEMKVKVLYLCDLITTGRATGLGVERLDVEGWRRLADYILEKAVSDEIEFDIGAQPSIAPYILSRLEKKYGAEKERIEKMKAHLGERGACPVGHGLLAISAKGDILPCNFLQGYVLGNVRKDELTKFAKLDLELKGKCRTCEYRDVCRGCRAKAFLAHGDLAAEDPTCMVEW